MKASHKINLHDFLLAWVVSTHMSSLCRLQPSRMNHVRHHVLGTVGTLTVMYFTSTWNNEFCTHP